MAIYLVYLLSMALAASAQHQMFNCEKINSCSCKAPGGTIDLSPLDSGDPSHPKFPDVAGGSSFGYHASYNPCSAYSESSTEGYCQNIAACLKAMSSLYSLGSQDSATFHMDPQTGLEIQYVGKAKMDDNPRTGHVSLYCDPNVEGQLTAPVGNKDGPDGSLHFYMILTSKHCCPGGGGGGGISAGSVLCILSVCIVIVYLAGGVAYNKYRREGVTGVELIPHVEFWKGFPGLVKEGIFFVFRCGGSGDQGANKGKARQKIYATF